MTTPALATTYLGLELAHPFMVGASPLADDLDMVRRLEDGGSSAIVLRSLFEEQITYAQSGRIHEMDPLEAQFAATLAGFPRPDTYMFTPDAYLEHIRRVKAAVGVPVIASLNGMTAHAWLEFARQIETAGADALELNIYTFAADAMQSSIAVEDQIRSVLVDVKRAIRLPVAIKLLPFFTAFAHFAHRLDAAGADGLVLFNRFYEPDVDIAAMMPRSRIELSERSELPLRLRWTAILHSRLRCSIAVTGGVATPTDGVKAILAGATAVQVVSAVLRHGPAYLGTMRDGLAQWLKANALSLDEARGRLDSSPRAGLAERANYIRTLQGWAGGS